MKNNNTLIVALDGLDYNLIKKHNCGTFTEMQEFGKVDNDTDILFRKTSELFASFHTGKTFEEHGIKGLTKYRNQYIDRFEWWSRQYKFFKKWNGIREKIYRLAGIENLKRYPDKRDLKCRSLFDKINNSKALNVPGYNPSPFQINTAFKMAVDCEQKSTLDIWDEYEYRRRKEELLNNKAVKYHDLVMAHFHRPDTHQHIVKDSSKLDYLYEETEELAKEILTNFQDKFSNIIFMSDHGLPTKYEHNTNAFYSSNTELFPDKKPHITDFHDAILKLTRGGGQ